MGLSVHWKMFSSSPGLSPLEVNGGYRRHTQNIQINKVIGENEKRVFCFTEKNHTDLLANPTVQEIREKLKTAGTKDLDKDHMEGAPRVPSLGEGEAVPLEPAGHPLQ